MACALRWSTGYCTGPLHFNHLCRSPSLFGICLFHLSSIAETGPRYSRGITERSNQGIAECLVGAKHICPCTCPHPPVPFPMHGHCAPAVVSGGACNISLTYEHTIGINPPHFPSPRSCKHV